MCVRENTSQAASVEFVRLWHTNYAHSRLQSFCRKTRRVFRQSREGRPSGRPSFRLFRILYASLTEDAVPVCTKSPMDMPLLLCILPHSAVRCSLLPLTERKISAIIGGTTAAAGYMRYAAEWKEDSHQKSKISAVCWHSFYASPRPPWPPSWSFLCTPSWTACSWPRAWGLRHGGGESGRPLHQRHVLHRRHLRRGHQYHPVHLSGAGQPGARQPPVLPESGAAGGHRPDHHRSGADLSGALCPAAGGGGGNAGLHHVVPEGLAPFAICFIVSYNLEILVKTRRAPPGPFFGGASAASPTACWTMWPSSC